MIKSDDACGASVDYEPNARDTSTTVASPIDSHARDAPVNDIGPRRSKRLSSQKKLDTRNNRKYSQTDKEKYRNNETLTDKKNRSDRSDDELLLLDMGGWWW